MLVCVGAFRNVWYVSTKFVLIQAFLKNFMVSNGSGNGRFELIRGSQIAFGHTTLLAIPNEISTGVPGTVSFSLRINRL
jgi:hypothetical protein